MNPMRLLVTGGSGFIGSHICYQARIAGYDVANLDNRFPDFEGRAYGTRFFKVDLRERGDVLRALQEFRPDLVCHQAAQVSVPESIRDPRTDAEINIIGGLHLLEACVAVGVKRLVFASSGGAIYGEVPFGAADERMSPAPETPYGVTKLAFEGLLQSHFQHHGLSSVVLRYANVYGPGQSTQGEAAVVAAFIDAALHGRDLKVFGKNEEGDGGCERDYVHVSDVVRANMLAFEDGLDYRITNVATGVATSTQQLAEIVLEATDSSSRIMHMEPRPGDVERSVLHAGRFRKASAAAPLDLKSGISGTVQGYRAG